MTLSAVCKYDVAREQTSGRAIPLLMAKRVGMLV